MAFCSNCGKEISNSAVFCGNCGNQINKKAKKGKPIAVFGGDFDFKNVLNALKKYFSHFYVDYNSKLFKFAMIIFLAIGIGEPIYDLVYNILPSKLFDFYSGASTVFEFLICALLFGIFSVFILKTKNKHIVRKSNFLMIVWIVSLILNALVFLVNKDLLGIYDYVLYSRTSTNIIELLAVVSTATLIFSSKPKYPIVLILSALSFALTNSSLYSIKWGISGFKVDKALGYDYSIFDIVDPLKYIILVVVLFVLVYIIPQKISKWLAYIPSLFFIVYSFIDMVDGFTFTGILDYIIDVCKIVIFLLFALSCSRKIEYDYIIEGTERTQKRALKIGVISASTTAIIVITYLLISAIVCSVQINSGIKKWESDIVEGEITSTQWSQMEEDIFKYRCDKLIEPFVDEYILYDTLLEHRDSMERILICYSAYKSGKVTEDIIVKYSVISVDEDWENDSILSTYYEKYVEMQPKDEKVSARAHVDIDDGEIEVTVTNDNVMPISKCTIECDFTILFIEPGSYSDLEYGRGSKTIEIEDIGGSSAKTEKISFNPDDYYDGYGSYITATTTDTNIRITEIE